MVKFSEFENLLFLHLIIYYNLTEVRKMHRVSIKGVLEIYKPSQNNRR